MRIFEQILLQTRQKFAGILGVWQEFLTQYAAKFAEKTQADAYAHKLSFLFPHQLQSPNCSIISEKTVVQ